MTALRSFVLLAAFYTLTTSASLIPNQPRAPTPTTHAHTHAHRDVDKRLPSTWYHREDHPAHALFRRQGQETTDGIQYAAVGSPTWSAAFPSWSPDPDNLPQPWIDALNAAVSAGTIPNLPQSTMGSDGNPYYPDNLDPTSAGVCSGTYQCRIDGDVWDAPDGVAGAAFDDGPLPPSTDLYNFLQQNGVHATHFMIGVNIISYWNQFLQAFQTNQDDIAVHTYTHPYMTTLSNEQVVGELGWTVQLIHNSTGGRLPRFWRPPYGDTDVRVHAIAKEVFGLTTILWNQDTADWSIGEDGGTDLATVESNLEKWYSGPKSPGLIILEHELSNDTVQAYINAFPLIGQNGWNIVSVARLDGGDAWQNVVGDTQGSDGAGGPSDEGTVEAAGGWALAWTGSGGGANAELNVANASSSTSASKTSSGGTLHAVSTSSAPSSSAVTSSTHSASSSVSPSAGSAQKSAAEVRYALPWAHAGIATGLAVALALVSLA